jgi:prevent-host-death family protein
MSIVFDNCNHHDYIDIKIRTGILMMNDYNVGVREAKVNLSKLLKRVKEGQEIIITDRGKPVGRIVGLPSKELSLIKRIEQMEEQGLIGPLPRRRSTKFPQPLPASDEIAQKYLCEDRDRR